MMYSACKLNKQGDNIQSYTMDCSTPGFPVLHQPEACSKSCLLLVMPSNHLDLCHPLLLLPSVFPSIQVFSNESDLHTRWPTYRSFSFSISPSSEHLGLVSFRMDWLDLLAVQGTLKSLLLNNFNLMTFQICQKIKYLAWKIL